MLTRKIRLKLLHWGRYLTNRSTRVHGTSEKSLILEFVAAFLPEAPTVVEAGAYNGSDTKAMGELWPEGTIYAFEPLPQLFRRLRNKTRKLDNVICLPLALSDTSGVSKMFVSSGESEASSSLMAPKEHQTEHRNVLFETEVDVETITLEEWAEKNRVKKIDFLWLDMQGHELRTLKAATHILSTVSAIYTEVSLKELYEESPLYSEVREWLEGEGFRVEIEDLPWPDGGNVLFLRQ